MKKKTETPAMRFLHDHKKQVKAGFIFFLSTTLLMFILLVALSVRPKLQFTIAALAPSEELVAEQEPLVLPRKIDGIVVAAEDANTVPVCVMIENAAFGGVRPQFGLTRASVVYEVIVEGGITRYLAVFAGEPADTVGPVRSARDTYIEFVSELNCAYAHAGGSYTAEQALYRFGLRDINGLRESQYFYREPTKVGPHNFFSSTEDLYRAVEEHNWNNEEPPNYASWKFVDPIPETERSDPSTENGVETMHIGFGGSYDVDYRYDPETNVFVRANGGVEYEDPATDELFTTKNVVIQSVQNGTEIEGKGRINWPVTGEGEVHVFHDGEVFVGTWRKENRLSRTQYFDADGNEIPFVRGNTWVEIVPPHIEWNYQ